MSETTGNWADQAEAKVLDAALPLAAEMGWTALLVARAAKEAGLSAADAELLLPGGPRDLAALFSRRCDAAMTGALKDTDPRGLKMRDRIGRAVQARLEAAAETEAATRRWAGFLALPANAALALRLQWESADLIWRWAGDTATDENHYSKRAILSAILGSALMVRLASGRAKSDAYVSARIGDVMSFEKFKAGLPKVDLMGAAAGLLGKLRYGG